LRPEYFRKSRRPALVTSGRRLGAPGAFLPDAICSSGRSLRLGKSTVEPASFAATIDVACK
jgi:hypothetical protein